MNSNFFFHQSIFIIRFRFIKKSLNYFRILLLRLIGIKIGKKTSISKLYVTWPHQVSIGKNCVLENGIFFKYDGIYVKGPSIIIEDDVFIGYGCEFNINKGIIISNFSNIASGCKFIDHNHGTIEGQLIGPQPSVKEKIVIGKDVWLGCNCIILKGVIIGDGSVVGAGSVVVKSIPPNEIWAGVPAKYIKTRI